MLAGRMMDYPLTTRHLLDRARAFFPRSTITSRQVDGSLHRHTYADFHRRSTQLAAALHRLGARPGDRVGTLAWNHHRHLELYFGPTASGLVTHTLNLRLHPAEIAYIANHAEDRFVVVDRALLPLWEKIAPEARSIERLIVIDDGAPHAIPGNALDYEELLAREEPHFAWPDLDEKAAAMICYTSGTTGNPKGVVFSHRSTVLHALATCTTDMFGIGEHDTVMPVVPMFHVAAWGLPFATVSCGSDLVFPGPHLDATNLLDLMARERVTVSAGVPTIWLGILNELDRAPGARDLSAMRSMVIGGSAAPPSLIAGFAERHGLAVTHAWGMTETSPLGTVARIKRSLGQLSPEAALAVRASQGYAAPLVEQRHTDADGAVLPWDGETMGELEVRGPWIASSYLGGDGVDRWSADGWFKTGDVVTIDAEGYVRITDRAKDVIKSGGEWISSVLLENALMSHPAVLEAAVFAGKHAKWDERPIAAIVKKPGHDVTEAELAAHLAPRVAKYWLPDAYVFLEQIPRTSTGKFLKTKLRETYGSLLLERGT